MSSLVKTLCLISVVILLLLSASCAPSRLVEFGGEDALRKLIDAQLLPQFPQNQDFQTLFETRLKELEEKRFNWPSSPAEITMDASENRVYIYAGKATISDIQHQFGQDVIEEIGHREYLLKSSIIIDGGYLEIEEVTLRLDATASTVHKKIYRVPIYIELKQGFLSIRRSRVSSWSQGAEAELNGKLRPFILSKGIDGESYVEIDDSELSHLGSPKREVAPDVFIPPRGPWGLSFYHDTRVKITNSQIHHNYMGLFLYDVKEALVHGNRIHDNISYGIDVHDDTEGSLFSRNRIWDNGNHGLILSKRCINNIIAENIIFDHTSQVKDYFTHGIMLHESSNNNLVWHNTLWNNYDSINIHASSNNVVAMNTILSDNGHGIKLWALSTENLFLMNSVRNTDKYDIRIESSRHNVFLGSSLEDGELSFKNARDNVFISETMPKTIRNAEGNIVIKHENPLAYYLAMYTGRHDGFGVQ